METKPRQYRVQKYRLNIVKEKPGDYDRVTISKRNDVKEFCEKFLHDWPIEHVVIIALNGANKIIGFQAVEGEPNQCALYPSAVFRFLLCAGACSFIVAHNHPGGSVSISGADWAITEKLYAASKPLDVKFLDHIIIADNTFISLRDHPKWPK